ncbi:MAG: recombinase family protein [Pedobacter sp.]|uniref:recombinase family protein n=1 Tax=Pedobacter sp. TaxID=1411316 RepID=UPI0035654079
MVLTPNAETKKFYAYCRESIDLESGIKIQKDAITNYAQANNIEILKWFIDNDSSAYEYRPNYDKMMKIILEPENSCDGIICHTLSRFGRSTNFVLEAKTNLTHNNKELILIKEQLDTTTPHGRLQFGIFVLFNDFEHDLILERTQAGIKHALKNGTKSGKPMHRPPKKVDWKKFDEMIEKQISVPSIAKMLGMTKKTLYNKIKDRK